MIRVDLPGLLELNCPKCGGGFSIAPSQLQDKTLLHCPLCAAAFNLYDGLSGQTRRRVYHAVRNALEQRVYEQYQMNRSDYIEDWGNLPTGSPPDGAEHPDLPTWPPKK